MNSNLEELLAYHQWYEYSIFAAFKQDCKATEILSGWLNRGERLIVYLLRGKTYNTLKQYLR